MKYTSGKVGRIFVLKFENNDILLDEIKRFSKKERLRSAVFVFIGAMREGLLVTGPKKPVIPPEPNKVNFKDGWEVFGVGTIFSNPKKEPQIHIHGSMGKKDKMLTGCIRGGSKVFLVVEAVVFEMKGVKAGKSVDPKTGLNLLML